MHVDFYYSNLRFPERNAAPSKRPTFLFSSCGLFCFPCAVAPPLIITHVLRSRRAVSRNSSGNTHQCLRCRRFLLQFVYLSLSPPSHRSSAFLLISDLYFFFAVCWQFYKNYIVRINLFNSAQSEQLSVNVYIKTCDTTY